LIISADSLSDLCELSAHVAVVGAGPAGIVIALEAAKDGYDILLIESGLDKFDAHVQQLSDAASWDPNRHAPMAMNVRRQLGGTSTIWGGRCVPYDQVDFDRRPYLSDTSWPVSYDELLPYFKRTCDWLRCGRSVFDVSHMAHLPCSIVPGLPDGDASTATIERWSLSTNFAREYTDRLRRSTHVRLVTGLTCTQVVTQPDPTRVNHLACRTLDGKSISVKARCYVLACGGLETTRLLLASPGAGGRPVGGRSGHLGSWYMGHVDGVIANVRFTTPPRSTVFGFERDIDGTYVRRRFSIRRQVQLQRELPNVTALIANPFLADHRHGNGVLSLAYLTLRSPVGRLIAAPEQRFSAAENGIPGLGSTRHLSPHLRNVAKDLPSVASFAMKLGSRRVMTLGRKAPGFFTAYSRNNSYPLHYRGEQSPIRQSRVTLSDDRDSMGMPRLNIDLRFSQRDVDGIIRCHNIWNDYLKKHDCGNLEYLSQDLESLVWKQASGGTHQLGTTRMAGRPQDGVVDENLAIHGMSNLFVASSSVFLTSSQANPTFMIVAFALRLADWLKSHISAL
jgi:choline dehydrogenase-like flavoprotein